MMESKSRSPSSDCNVSNVTHIHRAWPSILPRWRSTWAGWPHVPKSLKRHCCPLLLLGLLDGFDSGFWQHGLYATSPICVHVLAVMGHYWRCLLLSWEAADGEHNTPVNLGGHPGCCRMTSLCPCPRGMVICWHSLSAQLLRIWHDGAGSTVLGRQ